MIHVYQTSNISLIHLQGFSGSCFVSFCFRVVLFLFWSIDDSLISVLFLLQAFGLEKLLMEQLNKLCPR